jgi:hypothetical protein
MARRSTPLLAIPCSALLLGVAIGACTPDTGPGFPDQAVITLDRELLDGGTVVLPAAFTGTTQSETMQIVNGGRATLTVSAVKLLLSDGGTPPAGFPFSQPAVAVDAGSPGDPFPVQVGGLGTGFLQFTFAPRHAGRTSAMLNVDSDAPARPHIAVQLTALACAVGTDGGC